ncbi:VWA domain-containing protein [Paenibacillus antri]|uniref:VWA domain-containing protein n=1 Tax=Paenibacillus antri TaxID=2582848 RepID=A0A5R9G7A5_9BACL|nr:vWA domain-containing protein [Paenibacillus antri]TLS48613.1 VWA domain-containing protein [Paenibacillus antri]
MKQIIVITDGNSNEGISPITAAAEAYARGVVVNVIGVVDREAAGMRGEREIEAVAKAGGGLHRIVSPTKLAYTMQMMTRHTVVATIQQVVNEELRSIFKNETASLETLPPEKRAEVVRSVDEWTETAPLQVALLIDASASMKHKFDAVREAAYDLMLSMQARAGKSELAVLHFPGNNANAVEIDVGWTCELAKLEKILYKLNVKGTTPTGPAILDALALFGGVGRPSPRRAADAAWGDYVV